MSRQTLFNDRLSVVVQWLVATLPILALLVLTLGVGPVRAQDSEHVRIVGVDVSQPPQIEVTIQLLTGAEGRPTDVVVSLDGAEVGSVSAIEARVPVATLIVADLSSSMGERGAAFATRYQLMQPLVSDLVSQLQSGDQRAGLVVVSNQATVVHPLTNDLGAIANTLARSNPALVFEPLPAPVDGAPHPYPLAEGLLLALDQLMAAPPEQPRALMVFAAGQAGLDLSIVSARLAEVQAAAPSFQLLVYGFGDEAASAALQALAEGSAFTPVITDGRLPSVELKREIDSQFGNLIQQGVLIRLRFAATGLPPGATELKVRVGAAEDTVTVNVAPTPPRVSLLTSSAVLSGTVQLASRIDEASAPISRVEYLLDNVPISEADGFLTPLSTDGAYIFALDTRNLAFQQRFPPGLYELVAAVEDEGGLSGRSAPQQVTVAAAPQVAGTPGWLLPILIGGGLVATMGGIAVVRRGGQRRRPAAPIRESRPKTEPHADHELTALVETDNDERTAPVELPDDEPTAPVEVTDEERTEPLDAAALARRSRWYVEVVAGDTLQRLELKPTQRNYDLGRLSSGRRPDLALSNKRVSRIHARLELLNTGPVLVAGDTTHGTFFGPDRAAMACDDRQPLNDGDVFWLSPEVELRVVCEAEQ